jgi:uncharacterized oligopeptide transporter (OPT) family protein
LVEEHLFESSAMRSLFFAFLFVAAAGLIVALLVGVTLKIVGLLVMALLVVAAVTWVMNKVRGPRDAERLPR